MATVAVVMTLIGWVLVLLAVFDIPNRWKSGKLGKHRWYQVQYVNITSKRMLILDCEVLSPVGEHVEVASRATAEQIYNLNKAIPQRQLYILANINRDTGLLNIKEYKIV